MAEVDFSNFKSAEAWFETQSAEVRCAMTSRAALRVLANVSRAEAEFVQPLAIASLRCTLISAVRGSGRTADMDWWDDAARSAAFSAARSADSAALSAAYSAARSVLSAARSVLSAAISAHSANSAALSAANSAALWDSTNVSEGLNHRALWSGADVPEGIQSSHDTFLTYLAADPNWQFFHDWYLAMWEGKWTDWNLAIEVAKIDDGIWEDGLEAVAAEIKRIEALLGIEKAAKDLAASTQPRVTADEKTIIKQKVSTNRDALALSVASILEQLKDFRERVRGLNHLEPDFRDELISFIDELSNKLDTLLHDLPTLDQTIDDAHASRLAMWLKEFKPLVRQKAVKYIAPDNVAEAAIPTGIILLCTGVGSMMGPAGTAAGAVVGQLITNQVKPSKAAEQLLKSNDAPDAKDDTAG